MSATSYIGEVPVFAEDTPAKTDDDQWLVHFNSGTTDAMLEEFCAGRCAYSGHPDAGGNAFVVIRGEKWMESAVLSHQSSLDFVEHDLLAEDDELSGYDSEASVPWGVERVGRDDARGAGEGVNIYVMDSGVRVTHEEFGSRAIPTLNAMTMPPQECDADDADCVHDNRGHGSHCAGSAAGTNYGVAPKATIRGMNRGRSFADAFASMDWLAVNVLRPAVLTMSFGSGGQAAGSEAAVDAVVDQGITVTVSAGNNAYDACQKTFAFIKSAIVVGSSDSADRRSRFSNFGKCVSIFAPGSSIKSVDWRSDDGARTISGTSMATPHVAGGAAVFLEENPLLSPAEVRRRLLETAESGVLEDVKGSPNLLLNIAK